jgi:hypothetical protein
MMRKTRYFLPGVFTIGGISAALVALYLNTIGESAFGLFSTLPFLPVDSLWTEILIVFALAIPIIAIEFILLGMPLTAVFLIASKLVKGASYDINVMKIGSNFGGMRIIRRAAAPALFAVSFTGLVRGILEDAILGDVGVIPEALRFTRPISLTLMASLILIPVALALFIPTWLLNDAGVVSHLDPKQLNVRQPPHTEGVGRWYYNMLGGYSLIVFPITMFMAHFYEPLILNPFPPGTPMIEIAFQLFVATAFTIGAPVMVMAFIIPVVVLNEYLLGWTSRKIQGFAMWLGAKEVVRGKITEVKEES